MLEPAPVKKSIIFMDTKGCKPPQKKKKERRAQEGFNQVHVYITMQSLFFSLERSGSTGEATTLCCRPPLWWNCALPYSEFGVLGVLGVLGV